MTGRHEGTLTCRSPDGRTWRVESVATLSPDRHGRQRRIRVLVSGRAGDDEQEVTLALSCGSWLRYGVLGSWPPERAMGLRSDGDCVVVTYRDEWVPFERPVFPFGYDRESEWAARFDPAQRKWHLIRLRLLDYEAADSP